MAIYIFQHPESKEIIEIEQPMMSEHVYVDNKGVKWKRIFSNPCAQVKGKPLDFRNKKDVDLYNNVYKKRYNYNVSKNKIDTNTGKER